MDEFNVECGVCCKIEEFENNWIRVHYTKVVIKEIIPDNPFHGVWLCPSCAKINRKPLK
jgi:hypothetical protein